MIDENRFTGRVKSGKHIKRDGLSLVLLKKLSYQSVDTEMEFEEMVNRMK